jgi:hypothetical protein
VILGAGLGPAALAARDLEADGDVDLVVANGGSNSLSVLRQREGSFGSAPRTFDAAPAVSALAAADLDGDADIDLAASSAGGNMIAILGQEADGTFQAGTPLVTGNSPSSPVAADLDGDGDADLAVTVLFGIDLFLNQGGGAFAERVELPVGSNPVSLEAADLNGDGRLDLVTANFLSGSGVNDNVSVLLNAGGAVFAPARNYAVGVGATDLAIGDLDGDGDADLVVSNFLSEELSLLFNRGRGTFAPAVSIFLDSGVPPTTKVVAADHDADRDVDLFVGGSFQGLLLRNQGGGRAFQAIYLPSPFELRAFAVADLDRDGDLDLAARSFGNLTLFRQRSPAEFVPAADYVFGPDEDSFTQTGADGGGASGSPSNIITDLIASDLDGDGDADLAMALPGLGKVTVVYNHTRAASRDRDHNGIPDECESDPGRAFGRGDANLDGRLDLSDAVAILGFLFLHSEPLGCRKAADANDDGRLNLTDAIRILYYLFLSEAQPPEPFGGCGYDPTRDGLGCEASPRCP